MIKNVTSHLLETEGIRIYVTMSGYDGKTDPRFKEVFDLSPIRKNCELYGKKLLGSCQIIRGKNGKYLASLYVKNSQGVIRKERLKNACMDFIKKSPRSLVIGLDDPEILNDETKDLFKDRVVIVAKQTK